MAFLANFISSVYESLPAFPFDKIPLIGKREPSYCMGHKCLQVPMSMFRENRTRVRDKLLEEHGEAVILLQGGDDINMYSTDVSYLFRQEPYFFYMFGVQEPGFYGAVNIKTNESVLFIPRLPEEYAVWMGTIPTPESVVKKYGVTKALYVDQIEDLLKEVLPAEILTLTGPNTDSGLTIDEADWPNKASYLVNNSVLYPIITECRVIKSEKEIAVLRYANEISSEAHKMVMRSIKPGMYEYQAESIFLHYCYFVGGSRHVAYTCICGSGNNSSVLHYGHAAAPNDKKLEEGDMLLFDMGGSYCGYASDITCSFPVSGKFTDQQKKIYNLVLRSNRAVIAAMKPGVNWVEMHRLAVRIILSGLAQLGIIRGNMDTVIEAGIGGVFMPHGLGHFMGLDVHDVGGYMDYTPPRPEEPWLSKLRTARELEEGMVITVEPGCYFIDYILDKTLADPHLAPFINVKALAPYRGFGGVRIEDDVLVTQNGCEVLTKVPRTVAAIEKWMAGKPQPLPATAFPNWKNYGFRSKTMATNTPVLRTRSRAIVKTRVRKTTRPTTSRTANSRSTASRSTASRSTASRSTASRSTASRSTASRSAASRSSTSRPVTFRSRTRYSTRAKRRTFKI